MKPVLLAAACGLALTLFAGGASAEAVHLKAVSAFPVNLPFTKQFQAFIDRVNREGEGVVQIDLIGGPEVIPPQQQDTAIRNGVFDMQMGPTSYYNGNVPEADALFGATTTPVEARENGGIDLLDKIWHEKLNAKFLSWQSGGIPFYIYLVDEPKLTADGVLDLSGVRMRATPAYKEWFEKLGATNVILQTSEMFPALERGVVKGLGWPAISFTDIGVYKFLNYRVEPPVWQLDIAIIMNADKWESLSDEAKQILTQAAIEHEKATAESFQAIREREEKILQDAGMEFYTLEKGDKHRQIAFDLVWDRLKSRDPSNVEALREKFYQP